LPTCFQQGEKHNASFSPAITVHKFSGNLYTNN
jgi:hypothetical protein